MTVITSAVLQSPASADVQPDGIQLQLQEISQQQDLLIEFQVEITRVLQIIAHQTGSPGAPHASEGVSDTGNLNAAPGLHGATPALVSLDDVSIIFCDYSTSDIYLTGLSASIPEGDAVKAGSLEDAISAVKSRAGVTKTVLHLHHLEMALANTPDQELSAVADKIIHSVHIFKLLGGVVVWSVDQLPHRHHAASGVATHLFKMVLELADRVVFYSQADMDTAISAIGSPGDKAQVLDYPDFSRLYASFVDKAIARARAGVAPHETAIALVPASGASPEENATLRAFEAAHARDRSARLLVPAGGNRSGRQSGVVRIDNVLNREAAQWLLHAADYLLIQPGAGLYSGPMALARAFGLPVIAPASALASDIQGQDSSVVPYDPADPASLEAAILVACQNRNRAARNPANRISPPDWREHVAHLYNGL